MSSMFRSISKEQRAKVLSNRGSYRPVYNLLLPKSLTVQIREEPQNEGKQRVEK